MFFRRTLAAAGTLGAASGQVDFDALKKFRGQLKGGLVLPGDPAYEAARRVYFWNPGNEQRPALVAQCVHADDVRYAVEFARKHSLEVAVRGGGHSPMGWGISNGLVIDLARMNRVAIDAAKRTARIDAGVLSGEVMRAAGRHGLAPILGQCPGVGAAGVTLGGGLGWLSGLHGAACDNLLSARLATADGRIVSVDSERGADLLWGLRGAGANFGVMTSFDLQLHPVGAVTSGDIFYPVRKARTVLRFFRGLMAEAPDAFQATLNLTPGERGVFIGFCHAGSEAEVERLLRALRTVATPAKESFARQEFADLAARVPVGAVDAGFRSIATVYRNELSDEVIDKVLDRLAVAPSETILGVTHYMHGELCRVKPESTAFSLRQSGGVHIRIGQDWKDPAKAKGLMNWSNEARQFLRPASGERIYANYQTDTGKGSAEAVFGGNHSRLSVLKGKYDPTNFFRRNSNVEPHQG